MGIMDFFVSVPTLSAEEARRLIESQDMDRYNLIDVRQPKEYAEQHLPGARLIPLGELKERVGEIDPANPTIVY